MISSFFAVRGQWPFGRGSPPAAEPSIWTEQYLSWKVTSSARHIIKSATGHGPLQTPMLDHPQPKAKWEEQERQHKHGPSPTA